MADLLRHLMYAESCDEFSLGRENYQSLAPEITQVRCAGCKTRAVRCSNGVEVMGRLIRAQEMFG